MSTNATTVIVKIGGSTVDAAGLLQELGRSVHGARKDYFVIILHGGGKDIARQLELLNKEFTFVEGMRVTDAQTMQCVQMVLSGDVNKRIVNTLLTCGVPALGISGVDLGLFEAQRMTVNGRDVGFVGTIARVNTHIIEVCKANGFTPVISPVSRGSEGGFYNVNADLAAGELAAALRAGHLIYVSDVPGVLLDGTVTHEIHLGEIEELIRTKTVTGGMIPKLRSAAGAVTRGVGTVHICGWHGPETLLQELAGGPTSGTAIH